MSKNCNYVYVQGLRFRPQAVTVLWKHTDGVEYQVQLRKTGTGFAQCDENGIPLSVTPKDLKRVLKQGDTVNVIVHAMSDSNTEYEKVMLQLDPRRAEGRKGRKAFDAGSLTGLSASALRALALEQLQTAPYGAENRDQAVARILWGLENLDDSAIANMLAEAEVGYTSRSSTNAELAALLLSDQVLVASLMRDGKHESLRGLLQIAPLATATLAGVSRPAEEALAEAAMSIVYDRPNSPSGDPAAYRHALGYITDFDALSDLAFDRDPKVRIAAFNCFKAVAAKEDSDSLLRTVAITDSDAAVRTAAVRLIENQSVLRELVSKTKKEPNAAVFAATLEQLRSVNSVTCDRVLEELLQPTLKDGVNILDLDVQPSDEVLEHLVEVAGQTQTYLAIVAARAIRNPAIRLRVAGNTALAADIRADVVARIADAQERTWFTDPMHPTEVRCAAIQGYVTKEGVGYLSQRRLLELLRDHDPAVRLTTAKVLQDESALQEMATSDKTVAAAAAESLLEMGARRPEILVTTLPEVLITSLANKSFDESTRQQMFRMAEKTVQYQQALLATALGHPHWNNSSVAAHAREILSDGAGETTVDRREIERIDTGMRQIQTALRDVVLTETDSKVALSSYYALTGVNDKEAETVARTAHAASVRLRAAEDMNAYLNSYSTYWASAEIVARTALYQQALVDLASSDTDAAVRIEAAAGIRDQKALSEILESSTDVDVRMAVLGKVVSMDVMVRTLQNDASDAIRCEAVRQFVDIAPVSLSHGNERVIDRVAQEDGSSRVRKVALGFVTTSSVLDAAALGDPDPEVRIVALGRVSNQSVLVDIARNDVNTEVRIQALWRVSDLAVLADIATKDADAYIRNFALDRYNGRR